MVEWKAAFEALGAALAETLNELLRRPTKSRSDIETTFVVLAEETVEVVIQHTSNFFVRPISSGGAAAQPKITEWEKWIDILQACTELFFASPAPEDADHAIEVGEALHKLFSRTTAAIYRSGVMSPQLKARLQ